MSLINDVLKDLEQRQGPTPAASTRSVAHGRAATKRRVWQWPLWLLAAAGVGVVLHLSLDGRNSPTGSAETGPLTAQADMRTGAASTSPERTQPGPSPEPPSTQSTKKTAKLVHPETPARTTPELLVQAENQPQERPDRPTAPEREAMAQNTAPAEPPQRHSRSRPDSARPTKASPPETESGAAEMQEGESTISIRRSDTHVEQSDSLDAAKRMLARGQTRRAESRLRQLVGERPGLTEAHELLARTLIQHRQHEAAVGVLETGLSTAQDPVPLAALLGRLLIERGQVANARSVLAANAPTLADDPDYHLLLAAAHRQAGDHEQAAEHYRRLAQALPRRGAVWIGLGASLESLDRPAEAVSAYNRALETDDTRAERFARERLAVLEPITGEPQ